MARIQPNPEQLQALEDVNRKIEIIQSINEVAFQTEGLFLITHARDGARKSAKKKEDVLDIRVDGAEGGKLIKLLIQYKHGLIREIERAVKQYKLVLDDEDLASFSDESLSTAEETGEKEEVQIASVHEDAFENDGIHDCTEKTGEAAVSF